MIGLLRNFKIGTRILIGFIIILLLISITSIISYSGMKQVSSQTAVLETISSIKYDISQAILAQNKYENTKDIKYSQNVTKYLDNALKKSNKVQKLVDDTNSKQLKNIILNVNSYKASYKEFMKSERKKNEQIIIMNKASKTTLENLNKVLEVQYGNMKQSQFINDYNGYILLQKALSNYLETVHVVDQYTNASDVKTQNETVAIIIKELKSTQDNIKSAYNTIENKTAQENVNMALSNIYNYNNAIDKHKKINIDQRNIKEQTIYYSTKVEKISLAAEKDILEVVNKVKRNSVVVLSIAALAAVIFGLFITYLVTESIIQPMKEYVKNIEKFSHGDFTVKFARSNSKDELSEMAKVLNIMVSKLRTIIEDIKNSSKTLSNEAEKLILESDETTELILDSFNVVKSKSNHLLNILKGFKIDKD